MLWWHWLVIGVILVALEMAASGGFYVIFFGVAALAIAGTSRARLGGAGLGAARALFQHLDRVAARVSRSAAEVDAARRSRQGRRPLVGDIAVPLEDIPAGAVGRAELRGTVWSARNQDAATLSRGERCKVVDVDRLMIFLKPERERS